MKLQDLLFLIVFMLLLIRRDSKLATIAGIICLIVAMPLFALWIFFTGEHLIWYSAAFFLLSILLLTQNK